MERQARSLRPRGARRGARRGQVHGLHDEDRGGGAGARRRARHGALPERGTRGLPRAGARARAPLRRARGDAPDRRARRGPPHRRLREVRPALLLQELPEGAQARQHEEREDAEGVPRPAEDQRPLRAPDVLPALRGRDLRGAEEAPPQEQEPRGHHGGPRHGDRFEDPGAAGAGAPRPQRRGHRRAGGGAAAGRRVPAARGAARPVPRHGPP